VLSKALGMGLKTVLVINKIDRRTPAPQEVLDQVYSLYIDLGADDKQLEMPVLYTVARQGQASTSLDVPGKTLEPLYDAIIRHIPPPPASEEKTPQLLVANLDYDDYVGRLAVGRVQAGRFTPNMPVSVVREGGKVESGKIVKLYGFSGLKRVEIQDAGPGEIVSIAGIEDVSIGDTFGDPDKPVALPRITVDEPTMMMIFKVNDGPLAGKEGKFVTSRNLRERLYREAYRNVAVRVEDTETPDAFRVVGRGELALAVIIENMRREGYELTASNPEPITKTIDGVLHEPMELLFCDVPETSVGVVTERLGPRKGRMMDMASLGSGRTRLQFRIPARGLIGFRSEFLTITRGEGIMSSQFDGFEPWFGYIPKRSNGRHGLRPPGRHRARTRCSASRSAARCSWRGRHVYEGMIIGEHSHPSELNVNCCREKKLTNIRAAGRDENVILTPPREMGLEKALEWIADDELVEVTPKSVRMRKKALAVGERYRAERDRKREERAAGE
jgi:GTP-binding protein